MVNEKLCMNEHEIQGDVVVYRIIIGSMLVVSLLSRFMRSLSQIQQSLYSYMLFNFLISTQCETQTHI